MFESAVSFCSLFYTIILWFIPTYLPCPSCGKVIPLRVHLSPTSAENPQTISTGLGFIANNPAGASSTRPVEANSLHLDITHLLRDQSRQTSYPQTTLPFVGNPAHPQKSIVVDPLPANSHHHALIPAQGAYLIPSLRSSASCHLRQEKES